MSKGNWLPALLLVFLALNVRAAEFNYAELQIKALDEMQVVVNKQIKKAEKFLKEDDESQAVTALQSAVQFILSRPNRDNMVSQLIPPVRSKLKELEAFDKTLNSIVDESIEKLTNDNLKARERATYYFVLENFMSEFKPDTGLNEEVKKIFVKIRDAKIEMAGSVVNDLKMRAMIKAPLSPSEIAKKVIGPREK